MRLDRRDRAVLAILAAAFALRLWGIWNVTTTDEYNEVFEALRVCSGHINLERWIKRFYLYLLAGQFGVYYLAGWAAGLFAGPMDFAAQVVRNLEPLFLIGRFTSVVAGTATVGLVYAAGERFFSRTAGLAAALLLTLTVFHIDLSQQAKVDALLGLLVAATLFFLLRLATAEAPRCRDFGWCGLFMALAVQTKTNAVALAVPLLVLLLRRRREIARPAAALSRFGLAFLGGLVLGNPPVVLAPLAFVRNIISFGSRVYTSPVNVVPSDLPGYQAYPLFVFKYLGPPVCALAIVAILRAARRWDDRRAVLLSFLAAFLLMMGSLTSLVAPYYLIPALPALYLLLGESLDDLRAWLSRRTAQRWRAAAALGAAALLLVVPALRVIEHERSLVGSNTRTIAKEWIEANIPRGSRILMDSGKSINSAAPLIAENRASIERTLGRAKENVARGKIVHEMVDKNALVYYELLLQTVPELSYDITSTMFGLEVRTIDEYLREGFEYLVISNGTKTDRTSAYAREHYPQVAAFYSSLDTDRRVSLVTTVAPTPDTRGETYLVYRLQR